MTLERYQELINSKSTYKINDQGRLSILSPNRKMLIDIFCIPIDTYVESFKDFKERSIFFVYPAAENFYCKDAVYTPITSSVVLAECNEKNFAFSYSFKIDEDNETVTLRVQDSPELGKVFLSESELIGITKKLWKPTEFKINKTVGKGANSNQTIH